MEGEREVGAVRRADPDLTHWTPLQRPDALALTICCESASGQWAGTAAFPALIDPADASTDFEITGRRPYLYCVWCNSNSELDPSTMRVPVTFSVQ